MEANVMNISYLRDNNFNLTAKDNIKYFNRRKNVERIIEEKFDLSKIKENLEKDKVILETLLKSSLNDKEYNGLLNVFNERIDTDLDFDSFLYAMDDFINLVTKSFEKLLRSKGLNVYNKLTIYSDDSGEIVLAKHKGIK